jgi:transcriptional regulator with XRE-family HTH domain
VAQQQHQPPQQQDDVAPRFLSGKDARLVRQVRGLTQSWVAKRAGFSVSMLSNLESGKVPLTPDLEFRLIKALWP